MGGGLMQLVAHGAQDVYLTGDPQITYFKVVYRRHTNFSMESIQQQFSQTIDSAAESKSSCIISRNGDLIGAMYLQYRLTHGNGTTRGFSTYITDVEIEIGGQKIDKHYGRWLDIWDDLSTDANKDDGLSTMLGNSTVTGVTGNTTGSSIDNDNSPAFALVPLSFWFNKNVGLALPLIALQYHEVKLNFTFPDGTDHWDEVSLWVDYIFLDSDERKRFAQMSHEYLIDQVQFGGPETFESTTVGSSSRFVLHFNHPVKELIWVTENSSQRGAGTFTVDNGVANTLIAANTRQVDVNLVKLQINGHDRFYPRHGEYFRLQQPYQFHSTVPTAQDIFVYSFALRPEEHQPSGTCNFSRIDSCHLTLTLGGRMTDGKLASVSLSDTLYIYAINYNVLRIASGMAGLAYSN